MLKTVGDEQRSVGLVVMLKTRFVFLIEGKGATTYYDLQNSCHVDLTYQQVKNCMFEVTIPFDAVIQAKTPRVLSAQSVNGEDTIFVVYFD